MVVRAEAAVRPSSARCVMNTEILIGVIMSVLILGGAFVIFIFT